jgi:CHAT domain-containing protein
MATIEDETGKRFRFGRLPETATLAENLGKLHGAGTDLYVGLQANKATFLSEIVPRLDQYRWIVFATHGFFGTKGPGLLEPFLALSMVPPGTDGFLKMSDVMSLRLNADIVALTACRTGLGTELSGEGVMSMGRAFQYAGARSVLMTLWPVAEKSSVMLTESFFRLLKQGKSKLEAIKMARSELRTTGYDHPFFWAGFVLVGETE